MNEDKITMTEEMHAQEARKVWPGIREIIEAAIAAGRPVKITAKRKSHLENKEKSEDGRVHVIQSPLMKYSITVDTGKENISK